MSHRKVNRTRTQVMERRAARVKIVKTAERQRSWSAKPYSLRRINQAVCVVRRRGLVKDSVLVAAGFNPRHATEPHPLSRATTPNKVAADPADALTPPGRGRAARGDMA